MIIKSIEELRLSAPSHAIDSFDNIAGIIDNVEHDVLEEKLGTPLYQRLCQWYAESDAIRSTIDAPFSVPVGSVCGSATVPDASPSGISYYNRLWLACIRIVTQSALGRYAPQQAVSLNNAGVNQFTATDYPAASQQSIESYQKSCFQESAAACNRLLRLLEEWTKAASSVAGDSIADTDATVPDGSPSVDAELQEIVELWRTGSRYYYLSTQLLIPTATTLQTYINFAENREKFIQMLPDLLFIQEEIIANSIGDDFLAYLVAQAVSGAAVWPSSGAATVPVASASGNGTPAPVIATIIHRLRKVMAALLVSRTSVLKFDKAQKVQAHDDGVRMLDVACTYIRNHQQDIMRTLDPSLSDDDWADIAAARATLPASSPAQALVASPLYTAPAAIVPDASPSGQCCCNAAAQSDDTRVFQKGDSAAWTPPLF